MNIIHKKVFFFFAVSFLVLTSCKKESPTNEEAAILSLSLANVRSGGPHTESSIETVRIYIFRDGGQLDAMKLFTKDETHPNPYRIETTTGVKTIYVVANEPEAMKSRLDAVKAIAGLKQIETTPTDTPLSLPLMMVGSEHTTIRSSSSNEVTVPLTRLAAKITLKIKKGEGTSVDIKLTGVHLYRAAKSASLLEKSSYTPTLFNKKNDITPHVNLTSSMTPVWSENDNTALYLYENIGSASDTAGRATYLIIDALYNDIPTRYRAYINDYCCPVKILGR